MPISRIVSAMTSAFMDNVYNPSVKQDDEMPDEDEKSENFTPNLHQNENRELM